MKPDFPSQNPENTENAASRRQFLQNATAATGVLLLGRAASADETPAPIEAKTETTLKLSEHPDLQKVGGYEILEVGAERVIVAHTESGFIACSAVCPHKGCDVKYVLADKQLVCPCHNSRFDEAGKVVKGPARKDLKPFDATNGLVIKAK